MRSVDLVHVFTHEGQGGNPCPIVLDAAGMDGETMRRIAADHGHESGFVLPSSSPEVDHVFRFYVPRHEMEMCGHATIGMLWMLAKAGRLASDEVRIETRSGPVTGFVARSSDGGPAVAITQPAGKVIELGHDAERDVLKTLGLTRADLLDLPIQNAVTSRIKTLVPIRSVDRLNALSSDVVATEACCARIGSTGLYPYAMHPASANAAEARQFPKSSGYPEDAATGIAAAALAFGLLRNGLVEAIDRPIAVFQGRAMGRLSRIEVTLGFAGPRAVGCLLGGSVSLAA